MVTVTPLAFITDADVKVEIKGQEAVPPRTCQANLLLPTLISMRRVRLSGPCQVFGGPEPP